MTVKGFEVDYCDGDTQLMGYCARDPDATGPMPLVLVGHQWGGMDDFARSQADKLAELGYVAFALDVYGKGVLGKTTEEKSGLMTPFMEDRAMLLSRLKVGLETAKAQPNVDQTRVAAIGFCFGGLCALDLARDGIDLAGVVSFHALLKPSGLDSKPISARVLVLHGNEDPLAPEEDLLAWKQEFTDAGADWEARIYGHAKHAFSVPGADDPDIGLRHQPRAEARSHAAMRAFLADVF